MKSKYRHNGRLAGRELHPFPSSCSSPRLSSFPLSSHPPCFFHLSLSPLPLQYSYALNILMRREICKPCVTGNRARLFWLERAHASALAVPGCAILVKCVSGPMCDSDIKQQPSLHLRFPSTSIRVSTYRALPPRISLPLPSTSRSYRLPPSRGLYSHDFVATSPTASRDTGRYFQIFFFEIL